MTDVLERARNQTDPRTGFRYGDFTSVERAEEWREIVDALRDEITRLRASPWVSVCEWQWHKLAERMVTACGNESDSVGAFCQFCGGKVEVAG